MLKDSAILHGPKMHVQRRDTLGTKLVVMLRDVWKLQFFARVKTRNGANSLKITLNSLNFLWTRPGARRVQFEEERLREEIWRAANASHFCCEEVRLRDCCYVHT